MPAGCCSWRAQPSLAPLKSTHTQHAREMAKSRYRCHYLLTVIISNLIVKSAPPAFIVMHLHSGSTLGENHEHQACCQGMLYEGRRLLCVQRHPCACFAQPA